MDPGKPVAREQVLKSIPLSSGVSLVFREWNPEADGNKCLIVSHGLGEHSGRWDWIARYLSDHGWRVLIPDHKGHGLSPGKRGHIQIFTEWSDSLNQFRAAIGDAQQCFILGHSLGGLIAIDALLQLPDKWCGAVLSAPWIHLSLGGRKLEKRLAGLLSSYWPSLTFPTGLKAEQMAEHLCVELDTGSSSLIHKRISARAYTEINKTAAAVLRRASEFHAPCLLVHGEDDPVMNVEGSKAWFDGCGSSDKTFQLLNGERHEPHHGANRQALLDDILGWLDARSQCMPPSTR